VKKEIWPFLIKLVLSTLILGYIWFAWGQNAYPHALKPLAFKFFQLVGVTKWRLSLLLDHFTNIVPYIALVIATPGFFKNWKKTIIALLGGLAILIIGHLLLSWLDFYFWSQYQMTKKFFKTTFHFYLLNDALPLGLWLLFYPKMLLRLFPFIKMGRKRINNDTDRKN
jgi:hypothetical protein